VEKVNKEMIGKWVRESLARRKEATEKGSEPEDNRAKPPLHAVKKETEETDAT